MFDKTFILDTNSNNGGSINNNYEYEIKEFRAPTDESVHLLRAMEKEAMQNIIRTIQVKNNVLDGLIVEMDYSFGQRKLQFFFKLNGREFIISKEISALYLISLTTKDIIKMLVEEISTSIAKELLLLAVQKNPIIFERN